MRYSKDDRYTDASHKKYASSDKQNEHTRFRSSNCPERQKFLSIKDQLIKSTGVKAKP